MSVWSDMMDRGIGELVKKEDDGIFFKLNDIYDVPLDSWKVNNRIIFNQKSDHMCVGNFVTCSRIDRRPIFKLVKGSRRDVEKGVVFILGSVVKRSSVSFVGVLTDFYVNE